MSEPRWRDNVSGSSTIICSFTWGDGHICDQLIAIGNRRAQLLRPPTGHHFGKPAAGVYPLRANGTPRRPLPDAKQPRDEYGSPMWASQRWGVPTGVAAKRVIGEEVHRPARIRCSGCEQIRDIG